jgi:hypothetical protein
MYKYCLQKKISPDPANYSCDLKVVRQVIHIRRDLMYILEVRKPLLDIVKMSKCHAKGLECFNARVRRGKLQSSLSIALADK